MFDTRGKKERALGTSLSLKPFRGQGPKAVLNRRPNRPGQHGAARRRKVSDYGQQLAEKQKFRVTYGLREHQIRRLFAKAKKDATEKIGVVFMKLLERRLDNVVFRIGITPSRSVARQMINHGHIEVNGRRIRSSSYQVSVGDVIAIREASKTDRVKEELMERIPSVDQPAWLSFDMKSLTGKVEKLPHDIEAPFDISKVVDYYSKIIK